MKVFLPKQTVLLTTLIESFLIVLLKSAYIIEARKAFAEYSIKAINQSIKDKIIDNFLIQVVYMIYNVITEEGARLLLVKFVQ